MFIETLPSDAHGIRQEAWVPIIAVKLLHPWRGLVTRFTRLSINLVMFKWLRMLCGPGHYLPYNETQHGAYDTLGWTTDPT